VGVQRVEAENEVEQVFSLLNNDQGEGKISARMCKILNSLPPFFHEIWREFSRSFYVVEGDRFRNGHFADVGYRIASLVRRPVLFQIHGKKD